MNSYFGSPSLAGVSGTSSTRPAWLAVLLMTAALSAAPGPARADELEDCKSGVPEKVEPACTAIIDNASRTADDRSIAYTNRARLNNGRSKPELALNDVEAALQLNPKFVSALLLRGYIRQRSGSFDLARADFELAIELEPANAAAFAARGGLRNDQKAWKDAIADFNQAIALKQDLALAYVGRARAFVETAQLDQALGELNTALALNPNVANAFFWRGQVYRRKGDIDHAIEDFSRAIAQGPQTERASYYYRGQLFSAKGEYSRAIADFDKLLSLNPDNREVQQLRQSAIAAQAELAKVATKQPAPPVAGAVTAAPSQPAAPAVATLNQQIDQARQFFNQGNYVSAIERLNQVLASDSSN